MFLHFVWGLFPAVDEYMFGALVSGNRTMCVCVPELKQAIVCVFIDVFFDTNGAPWHLGGDKSDCDTNTEHVGRYVQSCSSYGTIKI